MKDKVKDFADKEVMIETMQKRLLELEQALEKSEIERKEVNKYA